MVASQRGGRVSENCQAPTPGGRRASGLSGNKRERADLRFEGPAFSLGEVELLWIGKTVKDRRAALGTCL